MRLSGCLIFLAAVALLGGCASAPKFLVNVSSLASPRAKSATTYFLIPGNKGITQDNLQFQEYASELRRALNENGFRPAVSRKKAEVAIIVMYGIGDPEAHNYTYSLPIFGQTGIASSSSYGTITGYGDSATYSGTTTYTPTYGITGFVPVSRSYTTYFRYAIITGFDWQSYLGSKKLIMLWKTNITSIGSSGDLRRVFPIMMAAAAPYLATDTGRKVSVTLYEANRRVKAIEGKLKGKRDGG